MSGRIRMKSGGKRKPRRARAAGVGRVAGQSGDDIRAGWFTGGRVNGPWTVVGCDPGSKGAVTALSANGNIIFGPWRLADTPLATIAQHVRGFGRVGGVLVIVEETFAPRNGQGFAAMRLGESRGQLIGMSIGSGVEPVSVAASVWQRGMGCLTGGDKAISTLRAQQLFGDRGIRWTQHDADSVLIAEWGRRLFAPPTSCVGE